MEAGGVKEDIITVEVTCELRGSAETGARAFLAEKTANAKKGPETRTRLAYLSSRNGNVALG